VTSCISKLRLSFAPPLIDLPPQRIHSKDAVTLSADYFFNEFDDIDYETHPTHLNFELDFPSISFPTSPAAETIHQNQEKEGNLSYKALQANLDETFCEEGDSEFFVWEQTADTDSKL
jgi:hypothetical protein